MDLVPQASTNEGAFDPSRQPNDLRDEVVRFLHGTGLTEFAAEAGLLDDCGSLSSGSHDEVALLPPPPPEAALLANESLHSGMAGAGGSALSEYEDKEHGGAYLGVLANQCVASARSYVAYAGTILRDVSPKQRKLTCGSPRARRKQQLSPRECKARTLHPGRKTNRKCVFAFDTLPEAESHVGGRPNGKGLRHFSSKVCEKVETKGRTTYNEVADELVMELRHRESDEKNIKRRVYDALNVLMALGIISKEKKQFFWKGLPEATGSKIANLEKEKARLSAGIAQKQAYLQELIKQYESQRDLIQRNKDKPLDFNQAQANAIQLPFFLVQVAPTATVEMRMSDDLHDVYFDFQEDRFQIHDDVHVLHFMADDPSCHREGPQIEETCVNNVGNEEETLLSEEILEESQDDDSSQRSSLVQPTFLSHGETSRRKQSRKSGSSNFDLAADQVPQALTRGNGTLHRRFGGSSPFVPWLGARYIPPMPNHA